MPLFSDRRTGELVSDILAREEHDFLYLTLGEAIESDVGISALPELTLGELQSFAPELDAGDHLRLLAAVELGRRVAEAKLAIRHDTVKFSSSAESRSNCQLLFARLIADGTQEEFYVLTLNTKNRLIAKHQISVGTLDASLVHPREAFRPAIKDSASSVIFVHNHPSGDPGPSRQDFEVTERLESAGKLLGIDVLDHIIVAKNGTASVRESR